LRTLVAAIVVSLLALAVLSSGAAAAAAGQADAYQQDAAHDGFVADAGLSAPLTQDWSITLPSAISYPLIVNGTVYVLTADGTLYALDQATGATVWSHGVGGSAPGLAYDGGQVYVADSSGLLTAFDAVTGSIAWSMQLPGQWSFSSAPTAANGMVYTGGAGSGGTLYAVRETDGYLMWAASVENGDDSSPAVDATGVYVSYACQQAYDFDPTAGTLLWHHDSACEGGGGDTPVLADGNLFARDGPLGNILLSASTGAALGPFNAGPPPAVGNGVAYMLSGSTLTAVKNSGLGVNAWQFTGDGHLDSAPLVVGGLVFEGSSQGELYALDATTGTTSWSTNVGSAIAAPGGTLTGLGAANGTLIVPAGNQLIAFSTANTAGVPVNVTPPAITGTAQTGQTLTVGQGKWTGIPNSFKYQWYSCDAALAACNAISGATQSSYLVSSGDVGRRLVAGVVAHNSTGNSTEKRSNATDAVLPATPALEVGPSISGPAQVGGLLTADPGLWSNSPSSYRYQWKECSSALTDCASLPGATSASYAPADSDVGKRLVVQIVAVNAGGDSIPADSGATAAVTVAKAPAPKCHVPRVVGLKLASAKTWIRSANCSVGRITTKTSSPAKRGRVLSESPRPGRTKANRAKVNLTVGKSRA
jgi:outer membrane protein assembly factor BamB